MIDVIDDVIDIEIETDTPQIDAELDYKGEVIRADADALKKEYDKGYDDGYVLGEDEGYNRGYDKGKTDEWSAFWDVFQAYGKRTNYAGAFSGDVHSEQTFWNSDNFTPKHPIKPTHANTMFSRCGDIANEYIKQLDFSECITLNGTFQAAKIRELGVINFSKATGNANSFNSSLVEKIELFIPPTDTTVTTHALFQGCEKLVYIRFGGEIIDTINMQWAVGLTVESAQDALLHLKNYAGTDSAFTKRIVFHGTVWNALEASGTAPNGGTWKSYVNELGWST